MIIVCQINSWYSSRICFGTYFLRHFHKWHTHLFLNAQKFAKWRKFKISELNGRFNEFDDMVNEMVNSNLSILRRCNQLRLERITQLERNNSNHAQYNNMQTHAINSVPSDLADVLKKISVPSAITFRNISRTGRPASLLPYQK